MNDLNTMTDSVEPIVENTVAEQVETTMTESVTTGDESVETTMTESVETTGDESVETTMETTGGESVENTVAEQVETKVDRRKDNPGRKPQFSDKWGIVEALSHINGYNGHYHYDNVGANVSRVLTLQLVELEYLETFKEKVTQGRGRAKMFYRLTGKGKGYLALSARWKKPETAPIVAPIVAPTMETNDTMDLVPAE